MVFGNAMQFLGQFFAALFGRGGIGMRIILPSFEGLTPRSAARMAFSIGADLRHVPGVTVIMPGSGTCRLRDLIHRRGRAVIIDAHVVEQMNRGAAGTDGGHRVLQILQGFFHALLRAGFDFFDSSSWAGFS